MISIQDAIKIAKEDQSDYPVVEVIDLKSKWGVSFDSGDIPIPDLPVVTVDKDSGRTDVITIPPIENLDVLESAPVVWRAK